MTQTLFYALAEDLAVLIKEVESVGSLHYLETGVFPAANVDRLKSALEIPQLGEATSDSGISSRAYLATLPSDSIELRRILLSSGNVAYAVDQLVNPDTVTFRPGGQRGVNSILHGMVGTVSDTDTSMNIMKRFRRAIRKRFRKVKAFYVGPAANEGLLQGMRLTQSLQSPPEFDLVP